MAVLASRSRKIDPLFWSSPGAPPRTLEQKQEHYVIEKELADRLRRANADDRHQLYSEVYDELFRRVPHHPQLFRVADEDAKVRDVRRQMGVVGRYVKKGITYLEVGAGDCGVALEVARTAAKVIAIEVSEEITRNIQAPANFDLKIVRGTDLPVENASVDLAYSNQLIEHLHPDDALAQLRELARVLRPGARYVCVTPNALSGPHDISGHFDDHPTGFHLKEYTVGDMVDLFRSVGFRSFAVIPGARGLYLPFAVPAGPVVRLESGLSRLSPRRRRRLARTVPLRLALGINFVATR